MRQIYKRKNYSLTTAKHVLVNSYFYTYIFRLLNFDIVDVVSFDTKYFFLVEHLIRGIIQSNMKKVLHLALILIELNVFTKKT